MRSLESGAERKGPIGRLGGGVWVAAALLLLPSCLLADSCLDCHGTPDFHTTDSSGKTISLYVDRAVFSGSIHGDLDCTDCHTAATEIPHPESMPRVDCGNCHSDEAELYQYHGFRKETPGDRFPDCSDCHGTHDILPPSDERSSANPNNLPTTCGRCHQNKEIVGPYHIPMTSPVEIYETSVHSRRHGKDGTLTATCIDCHSKEGTAHIILAPINPRSTIYHFNIPATCGRCHPQIQAEYERGVHGQAAARGETDTPVCTDCHGDHAILPVDDPDSRVSPTRVSLTVCAPCHESEQLNVKYGLPTNIMRSWRHSYHGLKSTDGDPRVANCSSCHQSHLILPASDPASSIAPDQVQATCSRCHPSITPDLASIEIHRTTGIFLNRTGRTFRSIYVVAIIIIIGSMMIHWLIDLHKRIRVLNQGEQVVRMDRKELWQHTLLMITFTLLVITGFAFHYSGSWWAKLLFGWPGGFIARRLIHLVSAGLFTATAIWHLVYLFSPPGRRFLRDISPRPSDFSQFFHTMGYDLGLSRNRPRFGRFSYIEKAEYWALVWGTVVMMVTGFALWFGTWTEHLLRVGALGVMLVVHFYEAILAGLAILIWHLYSTIFNPPVYPNNPSWYTGKMPVEMFRDEHPDDPSLAAVERGGAGGAAVAPEASGESGAGVPPGSGSGAETESESETGSAPEAAPHRDPGSEPGSEPDRKPEGKAGGGASAAEPRPPTSGRPGGEGGPPSPDEK